MNDAVSVMGFRCLPSVVDCVVNGSSSVVKEILVPTDSHFVVVVE